MYGFLTTFEFQVAADSADEAEAVARDAFADGLLTAWVTDPVEDDDSDRRYWHARARILTESSHDEIDWRWMRSIGDRVDDGVDIRYVTVGDVEREGKTDGLEDATRIALARVVWDHNVDPASIPELPLTAEQLQRRFKTA